MIDWIRKPEFKQHRTSGIVRVRIDTPHGRQWISTGQTSYLKAREVCNKAQLEKLQMAACANTLTAEAISRFLVGKRYSVSGILELWKEDAKIDLAPQTYTAYLAVLEQWFKQGDFGTKSLGEVKRRVLHAFVNMKGISAGTRQGRLTALKSYYRFANNAGFYVGNLAERVRVVTTDLEFPMIEHHAVRPMTEAEVQILLTSKTILPFWRWFVAFGWYLGLRTKDICCMEWSSIGDDGVTFYQKKTSRRVALSIDEPYLGGGVLRRYILEMLEATPERGVYCFPKWRVAALDTRKRSIIPKSFERLLKRHGIAGTSAHGLRHGFKLRLERAGVPLESISTRMGHASTATTELYGRDQPDQTNP